MKYELYLHDTSKPDKPVAVVRSDMPFSPIAVGDSIIGQGHPLQMGKGYTVARIAHVFPTSEEHDLVHRMDIYLAP